MENSIKEREFENAIAKYGGIITKICYYFSLNADEFNDLRQEVLYNVWKGWDKFRNDSKISTWIYRIGFNTCISYDRKERKNRNTISIDTIIDIPIEEESSKLEKYNIMHRLIQQLPFQERAIIMLWLDEYPYEEMAEMIGCPRNTIAVKLKRIKDKLVKMSKEG